MKPGRNGILPLKGSVTDAQLVCTSSHLFHGSLHCILSDRVPLARGEYHRPCHLGTLPAGRCHPLLQVRHRPLFAWFAWIPFTLFYLLRHGERSDFWRVCLCLFAGMTIALSCYVLLPTGLALRPYRVYGSDIFARLVRMLYAVDSSKNVCPSIHVLNTVTLMIGYRRSRCFDEPGRRWMRLPRMFWAWPSSCPPCCSSNTAASTWCWAQRWPLRWMLPPAASSARERCAAFRSGFDNVSPRRSRPPFLKAEKTFKFSS